MTPPDPSYAINGSNAKMMWNYSDDNPADLHAIIYSVRGASGAFIEMLVKTIGAGVAEHLNIPTAYKGRVGIEGKATLVIENVTSQDNKEFKCALLSDSGLDLESIVKLIVTGR